MKLVIVESPTKAKKLATYLGEGFKVEASVGHVRDLPKSELGIDIEHDFEPTYQVDPNKEAVVSKLQSLAKEADTVYLATDPDREGEAIAWHLSQLIDPKGIHEAKLHRATFHEITKSAVLEAMSHPGKIALHLVDAQQARRVVDRLVGYQVSPVLWKKVRRGLSAGRVQSVALRLIAEREREIEKFKAEEYWEFDTLLDAGSSKVGPLDPPVSLILADSDAVKPAWLSQPAEKQLVARVIELQGKKFDPHTQADGASVIDHLPTATLTVTGVDKKTRERVSLPPFTTSTLQQASANRLGFTSKQTMMLAQQLYEEGLITYHRTDSVSLSTQAIDQARAYIAHAFGQTYLPAKPRLFTTKSKNAQEAHEAIRVTNAELNPDLILKENRFFTDKHIRLYDLIRRRYLASQMATAVYAQTSITIAAQATTGRTEMVLRASGSILSFDGWMKLFASNEDTLLPSVEVGQVLHFQQLLAAQKFTQPPARYNDASLVKELEKRGIGRPSTYASIISVIVDRGYVERLDKRFQATAIGLTVSDFLQEHFPVFMEYDFTAEMEEDLDRISRGEKAWRKVIKEFYTPLAKTIKEVTQEADRVQIPVEETGEDCPLCGKESGGRVVIRTGRFGKFKSCNRFPECKFTENIVEKVEGVTCPLCQEGEVVVKNSRWGKSFFGCGRYPECTWASWKKPEPGQRVTPEQWATEQAAREERKKAKAAAMAGKKTPKAKAAPKKTATKKKTAKKTTKPKTTKKKSA